MHGAECWTDHRLIRSKFKLRIRPPHKKQQPSKRLNCKALASPHCISHLCNTLAKQLTNLKDDNNVPNMENEWAKLRSIIYDAASETVGFTQKRHQDWFDNSSPAIQELLETKRKAHAAVLSNPHSPPLRARYKAIRVFSINGTLLQTVQQFCYLGSILTPACHIDHDIEARINLASAAFGRLRSCVFENRHLRISTRAAIYRAVCVSTLLYGAEAWTAYILMHIRCLQRILSITWQDRVPHSDILQRTDSTSIEATLVQQQLRWAGHVIRMPGCRLPHQVLYGQLLSANRKPGGPKLRYKDQLKSNLKRCNINPNHLESAAANRPLWRSLCHDGSHTLRRSTLNKELCGVSKDTPMLP
ncbi:LOW QUALITY PROTEIN: uncharacterized protein LOC115531641 [Xyrichtys novacula]|uniref:LOW QUALITY PROTEIN: uncharacterized protein LOC115531641 n=1 Tax=Xyrichtys novacula TaxID=13765 RepID=A0AAV1GL09_XYRNO|nr:LOW QUALITY PROTEIN: uncharacterized protein LOC115531641 [Xyrichtys novacula]